MPTPPLRDATITKETSTALRDLKLKWTLKKMAKRLRHVTVPYQDLSGEVLEEWQSKEEDEEEEDNEIWLLRPSQWPNYFLQPVVAAVYAIIGWTVSVGLVFDIGSMHPALLWIWLIMVVIDIALNLNTVLLSHGRSKQTRLPITLEYLRKESYLDLVMLAYIVGSHFTQGYELVFQLLVMAVVLIKLSRKGETLRKSLAFKKYMGLVGSVISLIVASHLNVPSNII